MKIYKSERGDIHMWVIFLASAMTFAAAAVVIAWIANKIFISIKKDNDKYLNERKKKNNEN